MEPRISLRRILGHRRQAFPARPWAVLGTALIATASALTLSAVAPAAAERQPRIVFQREVYGGDSRILLSNSKGTWTRGLTSRRSVNALPRWGPYGHRILYTRAALEGSVDTDLMVMGARGRHKRVLLPGQGRNFIQDMAWSPEAGRVVLVMFREGGDSDLWVYTLATGRLVRLDVARFPDRLVQTVDWSRDGTIVFSAIDSSDAPGYTDLYFVRPDGSGLRQVTTTPSRSEVTPRFSPDGRRLVYGVQAGRCGYLVVARADGTGRRRAGAGCEASGASWSPNSRRLLVRVFNGRRLRDEIWAMGVDGSSKRFITTGTYASWRPR